MQQQESDLAKRLKSLIDVTDKLVRDIRYGTAELRKAAEEIMKKVEEQRGGD